MEMRLAVTHNGGQEKTRDAEVQIKRPALNGLRLAGVGALVALVVVLGLDLLMPSPVLADVTARGPLVGDQGEYASIQWTGDDGQILSADVFVPQEFVGPTRVPIVVNQTGVHVRGEWLPRRWYVVAAVLGSLIGGPVGMSLRAHRYSEARLRQVTTGAGV